MKREYENTSCHIEIHENKVADASAHHKQVENFMRTEVLVFRVKDGQFQGVDHAAHRVENPAR